MGTWSKLSNTTQSRTDIIPATPGGTYNSEFYIGLLKNSDLTTTAISDFNISKPDWVKTVNFTKSLNGTYYQLTYEVNENSYTSQRNGTITVTHKTSNKSLTYNISQSANEAQEQEPEDKWFNGNGTEITKLPVITLTSDGNVVGDLPVFRHSQNGAISNYSIIGNLIGSDNILNSTNSKCLFTLINEGNYITFQRTPYSFNNDDTTELNSTNSYVKYKDDKIESSIQLDVKVQGKEPQQETTYYYFVAVANENEVDIAYSLQVNSYNVGSESGSFATVKAGEELEIEITLPYLDPLKKKLEFKFTIECDNFDFDTSIINDGGSGSKTVDIVLINALRSVVGTLTIESADSKLDVELIFYEGIAGGDKTQAELLEDITGEITILSTQDVIPFTVTFNFK